ncbi:hypothetical protein CC1G_06897 [Coprinopsis cinerea okayama7|uniref:Uncharacterized protein n=1 Tax=Coprinopsis cinerea (strain Okayama-7 / 130 / ATCC MYA-4618 / FGSC 9003) TaxID=240176 RepID=A8N725_COPC7|nr:hypothetical protein CC1G_06897 [Coprinopsis cinerea okayama7\|eukprot:XP_001830631.1 hypothetical protein CC1G_06897 [Coprinopsis cinerea okayama7\
MFSRAVGLRCAASRGLYGWNRQQMPVLRTLATLSTRRNLSQQHQLLSRQRLKLGFPAAHLVRCRAYSDSADKTDKEKPSATGVFQYTGPFETTWRRLKLFSLASFGLTTVFSPFIFVVESSLPNSARIALATLAVGTSGFSTSLVAWCAKPYVTKLRRYTPEGEDGEILELTTRNLLLKDRITTVYDPEFLVETRRPMAKWELAKTVVLPQTRVASEGNDLVGKQETVAETRDEHGKLIGRWVVEWKEGGEGHCHQAGYVVRYCSIRWSLVLLRRKLIVVTL